MTMRRTLALSLLTTTAALGGGWIATRAESAPASVTPKTQTPSEARALSHSFSAVSKALSPSVVRIDVESQGPRVARQDRRQVPPELERLFERFFGDQFEMPAPGPGKGTGSGVVLDTSGNIITNSHVVDNASKLTVRFNDGREFSAKVVGRDPDTDVAVVKLDKPPANLVAARMGDSSKMEVGEWVLAIGSPLGLDQSVTVGIVSGKGRVGAHVQMSGRRMREYIQTDAKINPGNSGGPLVNLDGEVIGINTLINMGPGGAYGFAIPINQANRVAKVLVSDGKMRHAFLGIYLGDVKEAKKLNPDGEPDVNEQPIKNGPSRAAWVTRVQPNSPAQKAGLHVGDVITQIDGQKIEGASDVIDYVSSRSVGNRVGVNYLRDGRPATAQVTLGELTAEVTGRERDPQVGEDKIGLALQTLNPEIARLLGVEPTTKGVAVTEVTPNSRAARAGMRAEDVIVEINRRPVASTEEAIAALKENPKGGHLLRIRRAGAARFITIP